MPCESYFLFLRHVPPHNGYIGKTADPKNNVHAYIMNKQPNIFQRLTKTDNESTKIIPLRKRYNWAKAREDFYLWGFGGVIALIPSLLQLFADFIHDGSRGFPIASIMENFEFLYVNVTLASISIIEAIRHNSKYFKRLNITFALCGTIAYAVLKGAKVASYPNFFWWNVISLSSLMLFAMLSSISYNKE